MGHDSTLFRNHCNPDTGRRGVGRRSDSVDENIHAATDAVGRSRPPGCVARHGNGRRADAASAAVWLAQRAHRGGVPGTDKASQADRGGCAGRLRRRRAPIRQRRRGGVGHVAAAALARARQAVTAGVADRRSAGRPACRPQAPEAQQRAADAQAAREGRGPADSYTDRSLYDRCITRGVAGSILPVIYNNGNEIVQAPGLVVASATR